MRRSAILSGITAAMLGCGGDPCGSVRTIDEALVSQCSIDNDRPPPVVASCTPAVGTICTVIGTGEAGIGDEGVHGTRSRVYLPVEVLIGPDGQRLYYIDWNNHTIRERAPDGIVRTVAGTGELQDGTDPPIAPGTPRMAQRALRHRLNHPTHIAFDPQGRMIIAAWHNSMVKRLTNVGRTADGDATPSMIEDVCGTGGRQFGGDNGPALNAVLDLPVGIAVAPGGDIYISDQANQCIRRVDTAGMITTIAGTPRMPGYTGDNGPARMAQFRNPVGQAAPPAARIEFDRQGNLYMADTGNHVIRRIDTNGVITTVVGNGTAGTGGDGLPAAQAQLNGPTDIDIAPDGTLYIADTQNHCIRHVGRDGRIQTVAGRCGARGFAGDGRPVAESRLDTPYGIEVDASGRLWIADTYNQRVRVVPLQ